MILHKHTISFRNAWNGLTWSLRTQPNYKIHLIFSVVAFILGTWLSISYYEWLMIILLVTIGLVIETINTTIECTTDAIDKKWREDIRIAKDVAAASMLVFAMGAVVIAGVIFIPKILAII